MDKPMRCQCGRTRTIVLDKHFRTALVCPKCELVDRAEPAKTGEEALAAR
jgi:hypothetical protein